MGSEYKVANFKSIYRHISKIIQHNIKILVSMEELVRYDRWVVEQGVKLTLRHHQVESSANHKGDYWLDALK